MTDRDQRWIRRFIRVFPADFQADYARDIERTFAAQEQEARRAGTVGVIRLWIETLLDLARTAPRQHADQIRQDVRFALRTMARRPAFTIVTALVFAIGIAASAAVFSLVDAALLRPVPFADADRLMAIRELPPQETQPWELSYPTFADLRRDARTFAEVAAYMHADVTVGGAEPLLADAALISANLLPTLAVAPLAGRGFTAADDAPAASPVALIAHGLARTRFGSPERAVGNTLIVDDRLTTIVGVMPERFRFPIPDVLVWLPLGPTAGEPWMQRRTVHVALVVGRLRDGVSVDQARAELDAWMAALQAREPAADPQHRFWLRPLAEQISADARPAVTALAAAVVLLLAVTCSSVGLLLLMRAAGRSSEVAVRLSLGASRARLARQLMTEAICLALVGTIAGVAVAHLLLAYLVRGLHDALPPLVIPTVNGGALVMALAAALAVAIVCSLAPAAQAISFARGPSPGAQRSRQTLVAVQVAICCVLVVLATLLGRSLDRLLRVDTGFRADRLLTMRVAAPAAGYRGPGELTRFYEHAAERFRALPGVVAVTATNQPPVRESGQGALTVEGRSLRESPVVTYRRVLPNYFDVLGVPLVEGRPFTERDGAAEPVVIVSRALARRFWPAGQAVGKRIKVGPPESEPWLRVVGVVGDVRNGRLDGGTDFATYEPHAQRPWNNMLVMLRTAGDPAASAESVRRAMRDVEPQAIVSDVSTMDALIDASVAARRFHAVVVAAFAGATVLLVALALYGVLAASVQARTREMGIRTAIGATSSVLVREILIEGMRPALAGMILGLTAGALAASTIRTMLFQITPGDAWTYAGAAALILLVSLASCWLPARRAASVDASLALRAE